MLPNRLRRLIEAILPWYDPSEERARATRSEALRVRSISARIEAERVRRSYVEYANRLER